MLAPKMRYSVGPMKKMKKGKVPAHKSRIPTRKVLFAFGLPSRQPYMLRHANNTPQKVRTHRMVSINADIIKILLKIIRCVSSANERIVASD